MHTACTVSTIRNEMYLNLQKKYIKIGKFEENPVSDLYILYAATNW